MSMNRQFLQSVAVATLLAVAGLPSISSAGPRGRKAVKFKGAWLYRTLELQSAGENEERCGEGVEAFYSVRGVDNLGGLFTAEINQCFENTETGQLDGESVQTTLYDSGDTTRMVCGATVGTRNLAQCSQTWSRYRCRFVEGTGALEGIRGSAVAEGIESGSPCDGSVTPNSNDAGATWFEGVAALGGQRSRR